MTCIQILLNDREEIRCYLEENRIDIIRQNLQLVPELCHVALIFLVGYVIYGVYSLNNFSVVGAYVPFIVIFTALYVMTIQPQLMRNLSNRMIGFLDILFVMSLFIFGIVIHLTSAALSIPVFLVMVYLVLPVLLTHGCDSWSLMIMVNDAVYLAALLISGNIEREGTAVGVVSLFIASFLSVFVQCIMLRNSFHEWGLTKKYADMLNELDTHMRDNLSDTELQLERSRIKVMKNQLQPHFVHNALATIRIIIKRDPDYASDLLCDFSAHLRGSLKALSGDEYILFSEELENIKAYLNLEKMRFGEKLHVIYDIKKEDFEVISLAVQPIVENSIRHGIYEKGKSGGTVIIKSYETEKENIIVVLDDGAGFNVEEVLAKPMEDVSIKNLIYRLEILLGAKVEINSVFDVGTAVSVKIPKKNNAG